MIERIIASSRVGLVLVSLGAVYFDPPGPARLAPLVSTLLAIYGAYSLVLLAATFWLPTTRTYASIGIHSFDFAFATLISFLSEGPSSPLFAFFVFLLLSSGYRWGLKATLATGAASMAVLGVEAIVVTSRPALATGDLQINRFIVREALLLLIALSVGHLAEQEKRLRARNRALADLLAMVQIDAGIRASLRAVICELATVLRARRILLLLAHEKTGRLLSADTVETKGGTARRIRLRWVGNEDRHAWMPENAGPASCWELRRRRLLKRPVALDAAGSRIRLKARPVVRALEAEKWRCMAVVAVRAGDEWTGHLFVTDWQAPRGVPALTFLRDISRGVAPALYGVYLLKTLQSRAAETARSEVAHELHQGVIQALAGIDMQIDALLRTQSLSAPVNDSVRQIQNLLREQIVDVRQLMQRLRGLSLPTGELEEHLAGLVDRFERETGIHAEFVAQVGKDFRVSSRTCRALVDAVREALANVRKHSQATQVAVRLLPGRLFVADNGRGIPNGSAGPARGDARQLPQVPQFIREPVEAVRGSASIESVPGGGVRIEISFPLLETKTVTQQRVGSTS